MGDERAGSSSSRGAPGRGSAFFAPVRSTLVSKAPGDGPARAGRPGSRGVSFERILFSEAVLFNEEDVTITDADGEPVGFDVSGSNSPFMLISFGEPLLNDIYTITIADTVVSADGEIPIDGDNDGESGGDAVIVMEHRCRHDGDNNGAIATPDLLDLLGNWGECP